MPAAPSCPTATLWTNKRAELTVKSAERLVMDILGPTGSVDIDKFARALLVHRNTPKSDTDSLPAQIIFGRGLRDHLPTIVGRYQPRLEWRLPAQQRDCHGQETW